MHNKSKDVSEIYIVSLLSGEILPQRKLPMTITLRNISSEVGLIKPKSVIRG